MGRGYSGNHPRFSHRQDERYDAKEAYNKDLTASARLHYLENDRHDHESPAHSHCSPMHMHNDRHIRRQAEKIARKNEGDVQDIYYELKAKAAQDERSGKKRGYDERSGEERRKDIDEMIYERPDSPMNNKNKYARANDAFKAAELDAHIIGEMKKKQDRLDGMNKTQFGLSGIHDKVRNARRIMQDHDDLQTNVRGHMARDKATYPEGMGTYYDERSGGLKDEFVNNPGAFLDSERDLGYDRINRFDGSPMNACAKSEGGSGCIKQMGGAWRVISNKTDKPWPAKYASRSKAEAALRGYHAG